MCIRDRVMIGSLFAGHEESPGNLITIDGKRYKQYWGSASEVQKGAYRNVEGKQMLVPYRGSIKAVSYTHLFFITP